MTLAIAGLFSAARPAVVVAHCPGGAPVLNHEAGFRDVSADSQWMDAIEGWIGYTNPNPCTNDAGTALSAEYVNICRTQACDGWVQMGWIKLQGWTAPHYYCEFKSSPLGTLGHHLHISSGTITATTHKFGFYWLSTNEWECRYDGTAVMHTHTVSELGFSQGSWGDASGEAQATHGQMGTNSPAKLGYSSLRFHRKNGTWVSLNVTLFPQGAPYGEDKPSAEEFRDWTNVPH